MLINLIGFGSFLYLLGSFIGCSPRVKTNICPRVYPFIIAGGCPYIQTSKDPSALKIKCSLY
tara:strand:- start:14301 stop:14486 length:186 start_codon:yes stop_codon:yes gene_type:complete